MSEAVIKKISIVVDSNADKATNSINKLTNSVSKLSSSSTKVKSIKTTSNNINESGKKAEKSSNSFSKLAAGFAKVAVVGYTIKKVGTVMSSFISNSNSYIENLNLFNVAMGENASSAREFISNLSNGLGLDESSAIRYIAIFQQMSTGFGLASDKAYIMSKNLTQLGYDLSSYFNLPIEESMTKLESGIAGELEPLRRLGFALDEATLRQTAQNLGIETNIRNMTQAQKAQLRYVAIMQQSTNAQGDLARTLLTPANALRILQQQFTLLSRAVGNLFIPVLSAVLPYIIAFVKVVTMAVNALGSLVGFKLPEIDYSNTAAAGSAYDDLADSANNAADAAAGALAPFDKLNNVNSSKKSGSDSSGSSDLGIDLSKYGYDALAGAVNGTIDELVLKIKDSFVKIAEFFTPVTDAFGRLTESVKPLGETIGSGLKWFWDNILKPFGEWAVNSLIPQFLDTLSSLFSSINGLLPGVGDAFKIFWDNIASPTLSIFGDVLIAGLKWISENSDGVVVALALIGTAWAEIKIGASVITLFEMITDSAKMSVLATNVKNFATAALLFYGIAKGIQLISDTIDGSKSNFELFTNFLKVATAIGVGIGIAFGLVPGLIAALVIAVGYLILYVSQNWEAFTTGLKYLMDKVIDGIVGAWTWLGDQIVGGLNWIGSGIVNGFTWAFNTVKDAIGGVWNWIKNTIGTIGTFIGNTIGGTIKGIINGVMWAAEKAINGFFYPINAAIGVLRLLPGLSNLSKISVSLPRFEDGGIGIPSGQLFIANEAGPELVGTMGGKTTVANNGQIETGIEEAAYRGFLRALSGSANGKPVVINLDGKTIAKNTIDFINGSTIQTGVSPVL